MSYYYVLAKTKKEDIKKAEKIVKKENINSGDENYNKACEYLYGYDSICVSKDSVLINEFNNTSEYIRVDCDTFKILDKSDFERILESIKQRFVKTLIDVLLNGNIDKEKQKFDDEEEEREYFDETNLNPAEFINYYAKELIDFKCTLPTGKGWYVFFYDRERTPIFELLDLIYFAGKMDWDKERAVFYIG